MMPPIRLLIVDDSVIARAVMVRMIAAYPEFEVAAEAASAPEAFEALDRAPVDIVLLDVEMPGLSGLDALPEIMRRGRGARVLVVSSLAEAGGEATMCALAAGAVDTLPKPTAGAYGSGFADRLAEKLRAIGAGPARAASVRVRATEASIALRPRSMAPLGCIAIGGSTGGISALNAFLNALPAMVGVPVLVTQHLPAAFMPLFARQLEATSGRAARLAAEGMRLHPDEILVAPGHAHLTLDEGAEPRVRLDAAPAPAGCVPAVDPMFAAVAAAYGAGAVAVLLSGMGRDGVEGAGAVAAAGGTIIVQDAASSAVWGMPKAAVSAGLASAVLPPDELARWIGMDR